MSSPWDSPLVSDCCGAQMRSSEPTPDFIGDRTVRVETVYAVCVACEKPCSPVAPAA